MRDSPGGSSEISVDLRARVFGADALSHAALQRRFDSGAHFTATHLTEVVGLATWYEEHGKDAVPLIVVRPSGDALVSTPGMSLDPKAGDILIGITEGAAT